MSYSNQNSQNNLKNPATYLPYFPLEDGCSHSMVDLPQRLHPLSLIVFELVDNNSCIIFCKRIPHKNVAKGFRIKFSSQMVIDMYIRYCGPHISLDEFPLDGELVFYLWKKLFLEKTWSYHLFLFYFLKGKNKIRNKTLSVTPYLEKTVYEIPNLSPEVRLLIGKVR